MNLYFIIYKPYTLHPLAKYAVFKYAGYIIIYRPYFAPFR